MEAALKEGKYIYCIINSNEQKSFGPTGIGGRGDEINAICFNDIAAVVSNSPIRKYPLSRDNLIPHERAIEDIMKDYTVLPVRFATIAEDEITIRKILEKEYDRFTALLTTMEGKKELAFKAILKEDIIYKDILDKYKDIRKLKENIAALSADKSHYQRMEIGRLVESALKKEKEIFKKDILDALSPLAVETKSNNTYGELMILNAAFLVEDRNEAKFDERVNELAAEYGDKMKFNYVGPLPPFNFVTLIIETGLY